MAALHSRYGHNIFILWFLLLWPPYLIIIIIDLIRTKAIYIFIVWFLVSFFISSPNLSGRTLDVYHTSTHGVALVRI